MRTLTRLNGWILLAALVAIPACGNDDLLGPGATQGIYGLVLVGPQCPVHGPGVSCPDVPYSAWIKVLSEGGGLATRVRAGEDGRFEVGLRAGRYILDPESDDPFPFAGQLEVDVLEGVYTEVTISFDTGIR
jgi:hypothetical protein